MVTAVKAELQWGAKSVFPSEVLGRNNVSDCADRVWEAGLLLRTLLGVATVSWCDTLASFL